VAPQLEVERRFANRQEDAKLGRLTSDYSDFLNMMDGFISIIL